MTEFIEFETRIDLWEYATKFINNTEIIGVSGGSAGEIVKYSSGKEWFLVDERIVEYDSQYCNCRILRESTFDLIHCLYHDKNYLKEAPKYLDKVVMGIGNDGHIASLFQESTFDSTEISLKTISTDTKTKQRISLSMKYLLNSSKVLFILTGQHKLEIWNKIKNNQVDNLPIGYFLNNFKGESSIAFCK